MHMEGMHILQPTALAIKQVPSSSATVNTGGFPHELTITLRHIPQPEYLAKNCGRTRHTTYQAFLVNNSHNTKTFLGPIRKLRPGTFQLIAENISTGTWDQLVVSLTHDDPSDLGMPIFTYEYNFCNPPERYTALPADFPRTDQPPAANQLTPKTKQNTDSGDYNPNSAGQSGNGLLKPGTVLPEQSKPFMSPDEAVSGFDSEDERLLLQPGTVLPEDETYAVNPGITSPSHQKTAPMDGPAWLDLGASGEKESEQSLAPLVINELPHHALWLVNYQGVQLVGYVFEPFDPKKPIFIVHGVPGDYSRRAKPKEQGYEYWIADPAGKSGYWLRYVNPLDNLIVYPFPVKEGRRK